jgi:predicted phosphodiesterase
MRIAVFSDIHGNAPALRAAVADARTRGAERFFCAGDLTGYGPFPSEVLEICRMESISSIIGNYDAKVLKPGKRFAALKKKMKPYKWRILDWTRSNIGRGGRRYLESLPLQLREPLPGGRTMLMVHGSPLSYNDTIYPSITAAGFAGKLIDGAPDVLVCGHTHIPFARRISNCLVMNASSTGFPVDGDPRPAYGLIEIGADGTLSGRIVRFPYAIEEVTAALRASGLPKRLVKDFREGNKKRETP